MHLLLLLCAPLGGCAAAGAVSTVAQVANLALGAAGLTKPADPNATKDMPIAIHADSKLNTDTSNRSYSVVVRVYQLKQSNAFKQAYYDVFLDPQKEKEALGSDVLVSREITLIPGQDFSEIEKISMSADFIGIVALFQDPAPERWKLIFPAKDLDRHGITLGLGACSITVSSGKTQEDSKTAQIPLNLPANCG